jgi:hypothetical protein
MEIKFDKFKQPVDDGGSCDAPKDPHFPKNKFKQTMASERIHRSLMLAILCSLGVPGFGITSLPPGYSDAVTDLELQGLIRRVPGQRIALTEKGLCHVVQLHRLQLPRELRTTSYVDANGNPICID